MLVGLDGSKGPASQETIGAIYRLFHGMKGNAGFLGLDVLVALTHRAETVLGLLRDGKLEGSQHLVDVLIRACDLLRLRVDHAEATLADLPEDERTRDLIEDLARMASTEPPARAVSGSATGAVPSPSTVTSVVPTVPSASAAVAVATPPAGAVVATAPPSTQAPLVSSIQSVAPPDWFLKLAAARSLGDSPAEAADGAAREASHAVDPSTSSKRDEPRRSAGSLRVDVEKLDQLMDLVGELIIAGTGVAHHPLARDERNEELHKSVVQLTRVMRGLQDVALSVRMVPIEPTFRKMVRLVHDVSTRQGKRAQLEISGAETEVDKAVAELIGDPLVHLLRNGVDHGLESPEERVALGKPASGTIRLSAAHHGGEVIIRVQDDGRGLSRERILEKAISRGLVDRARAAALRDEDVWSFIFEPGFSTAAAVTDISGRGVGMDVVKKNIESMKGRIEVRSAAGQGSVFTLRIPLTLALVDGLLVRTGDVVFIVPLPVIRESVVVSERDVTRLADGEELVRIRNEMVPVLRLHRRFALPCARETLAEGVLVVVEDGGAALALFADELLGQRQTVIKPLGGFVGDTPGVAGCTVLGDGQVGLILDVPALMSRVRVREKAGGRS